MRQKFLDWNYSQWMESDFKKNEADIASLYNEKSGTLEKKAVELLKDGE